MWHMVCVKNGAFHTIGHQWFLLDQTLRFEVKWHNGYSIQQRLSSEPVNARNPGIINSSNTAHCWNLLLLCAKCSNNRAQVGEMRQIMRTPLIKECGAIASLLPPADLWAPMPQRVTWQSQGAPISPTQVIKGKRMIHLILFHWVFLGNHSKRFWLWILF